MSDTLTSSYVPATLQVSDVRIQPPLVYVQPVWEYKHVTAERPPEEAELNTLGAEGWDLVGVLPAPDGVHLYFKRLVR